MPAFYCLCNSILSGRQASFSRLLQNPFELLEKTEEHGSDQSKNELIRLGTSARPVRVELCSQIPTAELTVKIN